MLTYCYAWTPLIIIGTLSLLAIPWLGLIALLIVVLGLLALLAGLATVIVRLSLGTRRAILHLWHTRIRTRPGAVVTWAGSGRKPTGSIPAAATARLPDADPR